MHHLRLSTSLLPTLLVLAVASSLGCNEDHEENPNTEACEHLAGGTSMAVTATTTAGAVGAAQMIGDSHLRYEVTLVGAAGARGGFVGLQSTGGEYIVYTSEPVKLTVTNPNGGPVAAESTAATVPECTAVKGRHVYDLHAAGRHLIEIGPETTIEKVSIVVEPGSHSH